VALLLLFVISFRVTVAHLYLEVVSYPNGEIFLQTRVERGFHFSTLIRHSVHLTPVYERYRIEDEGQIVLESTRLQDLGWGVPSTYDNPSRIENGFLVIEEINKILPSLPFRVSYINNPRLLLEWLCNVRNKDVKDKSTVHLDDYVKDGKRVDIRVRRVSFPAFRSFFGQF